MNWTSCQTISMTMRNTFRFPTSESLTSASRSSSTSWASSYRTTSMKFSEYSAEKVATLDLRTCWFEGAHSINGTVLNRKRRKARCGGGAILIRSRSAMKTKGSTLEERDDVL